MKYFSNWMRSPPARVLLLAISAAAAIMLGAALVAQYAFGLHPCELCLYQRYPYAAIIVLGLLSAWLVETPRLLWAIAGLCGLLFLADAGIATYHAGVEWGWFPGPSDCSSAASRGDTLEAMRRAIMNAPLVPCNQPMARFFGLSMAGWNALMALALAISTFAIIYRHARSVR